MDMKEYQRKAEALFTKIEAALDELEEELDYDTTDGKIQIVFENGQPPVVVNTQRAIHEIWLAGRARGWHFKFQSDQDRWFAEAEQEEFYDCFNRLVSENLGRQLDLRPE